MENNDPQKIPGSPNVTPQSQDASQAPFHPSHRHIPTWMILILALSLIIIAIISTQLLSSQQINKQPQLPSAEPTPTPDPTANWKTFENTKYGYSLKVPSDWIKQNKDEYLDEFFYQSFSPNDEKHCELGGYPCYPTISLTAHNQLSKKSRFKTLNEYFNFIYNLPISQETRTDIDGAPRIIKVIDKMIINNDKAVRYFVSIPPEFDGIDVARTTEAIDIFKNERIYSLSHDIFTKVKSQKIDYTQDEKETEIFNQILSTFKFLNEDKLQALTQNAKQQLAAKLQIQAETIQVITAEKVEWSDSSLGCPKPGYVYAQSLVGGYLIILSNGKNNYAYHSGLNGDPFYCEDTYVKPPLNFQ